MDTGQELVCTSGDQFRIAYFYLIQPLAQRYKTSKLGFEEETQPLSSGVMHPLDQTTPS